MPADKKQYTEEEVLAFLNNPENKREMIKQHLIQAYGNRNIHSEYLKFRAGEGPYKELRDRLRAVERQMHDIPPAVYNRPFTI